MRRGLLLVALALGLTACQQSPPAPPSVVASVGPRTAELRQEGDELAARNDFEHAVVKYQTALNQEPADVSLHYRLAVALSHLDRGSEATEHFQYVVTHARPASAESEGARSWLASAGEGREGAPPVTPAPASPAGVTSEPADDAGGKATLKGKLDWGGIDPHDRLIHAEATLVGDDVVTRDVKRQRPFRIGQAYEFRNLLPGKYRLTVRALDTEVWDQTVNVEEKGETILDLTQRNSAITTKEFPPRLEN